MQSKICTQCGLEKNILEFNKRAASKDGYAPLCKQCKRIYDNDHYKKIGKQYYTLNKDKFTESSKKWRNKNLKYQKEWRIRNSGYAKCWYENNKEKCKLSVSRWYEANKYRSHANAAAYRARKLNSSDVLSEAERVEIKEIYKRCSDLNSRRGGIKWHVDHRIPLIKGGIHHPGNLQILEATANMSKGCRLI